MSRYTDPSGLADRLIELAVALLIVAVLLTLAVALLVRIWLWLVAGALLIALIWLVVVWVRWRRTNW